jgi:hypothetical protein
MVTAHDVSPIIGQTLIFIPSQFNFFLLQQLFVLFKILPGNKNSRTIVKNKLETPFLANAVRLVKWTVKAKPCLKFEIYGCYPGMILGAVYTTV